MHQLSGGVPRLVNNICERSMMGAYGENVHRIDKNLVRKAAGEVLQPTEKFQPMQWVAGGAIAAGAAALLLSIWGFLPRTSPESYANTNTTNEVEVETMTQVADEPLASHAVVNNKPLQMDAASLSEETPPTLNTPAKIIKQNNKAAFCPG